MRSSSRAATDGGQESREPKAEPEPSHERLFIDTPAVGLDTRPNLITGEVFGSGTSGMIPDNEGGSNSRVRLDASESFAAESDCRDSTGWELDTPGRYWSRQLSIYGPGPRPARTTKRDITDLPEPTQWTAGDGHTDAPEMCHLHPPFIPVTRRAIRSHALEINRFSERKFWTTGCAPPKGVNTVPSSTPQTDRAMIGTLPHIRW